MEDKLSWLRHRDYPSQFLKPRKILLQRILRHSMLNGKVAQSLLKSLKGLWIVLCSSLDEARHILEYIFVKLLKKREFLLSTVEVSKEICFHNLIKECKIFHVFELNMGIDSSIQYHDVEFAISINATLDKLSTKLSAKQFSKEPYLHSFSFRTSQTL